MDRHICNGFHATREKSISSNFSLIPENEMLFRISVFAISEKKVYLYNSCVKGIDRTDAFNHVGKIHSC